MSGLCHSVVAGTQKLSGYSDTIIDEVIDGTDVFFFFFEIEDRSSFFIFLLGLRV